MASFLFRLIRVLIVLIIAFGAAFWLYASREKPLKKKVVRTPPGVRVIEAMPQAQTMTVEAFGTVAPRNRVNLAMEVSGRIDYIHPGFHEGAVVKKGALLIRVDQRALTLDKETARVRVEKAQADIRHLTREIENLKADAQLAKTNMELSRKELNRVKALSENQFASKTSLDKAEQQFLAARIQHQSVINGLALTPSRMAQRKSDLAMAKANLDQVLLLLEKSAIRAGFDGFVLTKQVELGEYVNPGQILGVIYEKGALDVDVRVPFEDLRWLKSEFDRGASPFARVSIANLEGVVQPVWKARVARIKARIDEKTRTLPMTIEIGALDPESLESGQNSSGTDNANPLLELKPGTFVKCRIDGETRDGIFKLPRYLMRSPQTLYLAAEGQLEIRQVNVLRRFEGAVYISNGLSKGDLVISSPLPGALNGMPVTIKDSGENK